MTQLQTINTENYAAMAQLMGVSGATPQKAKSSTLPRLRIWNQGVKEKDGKAYRGNYSIRFLPSGSARHCNVFCREGHYPTLRATLHV